MNHKQVHEAIECQHLLAEHLAEELRYILRIDHPEDDLINKITGREVLDALCLALLDLSHGSASTANKYRTTALPSFGSDAEARRWAGV